MLRQLKNKLRPFHLLFKVLLFGWVLFMSFGGVQIGEPPAAGDKRVEEFCALKLSRLFDDYQAARLRQKFLLLTDNPRAVPIKYLKKYFKVANFSRDERGLQAFNSSDVFWFDSMRLPLNTKKPCSLLFQNSLEHYEELHLKPKLAKLAAAVPGLKGLFPKTYNLDDPADAAAFFGQAKEKVASKPKFVVKAEDSGKLASHRR